MKTLTVQLPDALLAELEAESRRSRLPMSAVAARRIGSGLLLHRPASMKEIAAMFGVAHASSLDNGGHRKKPLYGGKPAH